jgi:ADP-L-glycero-D-manno-heptose 6-epimerase
MGACSSTTEWNGKYLMENNYEYSKEILHWSLNNGVQLIYASSASVYGLGHDGFSEDLCLEHPLNMYAYSKHLFDVYARKYMNDSQNSIVGLRFFNVYGPGEDHKNEMASTVYHFYNQLIDKQEISLFGGNAGYLGGEQSRDFVYVEDCALVCIWFHENQAHSGIYNVGSGISSSFNEVANRIITEVGYGEISYIPFPDHLIDAYQSYTLADLTKLRNVGCNINFRGIEQGVRDYINNYLSKK